MRDALPDAGRRAPLRVIGVGNAYRADDAAGLAVARALRGELGDCVGVLEREGEPTALIDAWENAQHVWIIDAVRSGAPPGTVHRVDAAEQSLPSGFSRSSTHHFGLPEAIELARALGRLPASLVVYGIEGERFDAGDSLTEAVAAAVPAVAGEVRREVGAHTSRS